MTRENSIYFYKDSDGAYYPVQLQRHQLIRNTADSIRVQSLYNAKCP